MHLRWGDFGILGRVLPSDFSCLFNEKTIERRFEKKSETASDFFD
jgi:hypothetical protein